MDVQYAPEVRQSVEEFAALKTASALLPAVLRSPFARGVTAEWTRAWDSHGRPLARLTFRDSEGEASTDFTSEDLRIPRLVKHCLNRLWGDLLEIHSDKQMERVLVSVGQIGSDEGE